jgi:CRP-like cAMP-binding protein
LQPTIPFGSTSAATVRTVSKVGFRKVARSTTLVITLATPPAVPNFMPVAPMEPKMVCFLSGSKACYVRMVLMTDPTPVPLTASRTEQIFPILNSTQAQRLVAQGHARSVHAGDVLVEPGDPEVPIFVVISGELEAVRPSFVQETLITIFAPGQFTGEVNTLSGRRAIARIRTRKDGEIVEIARGKVLALVQTDAELSEILMRAFILRRAELRIQVHTFPEAAGALAGLGTQFYQCCLPCVWVGELSAHSQFATAGGRGEFVGHSGNV